MSTIGTTLFSKIEINGQEVDIATLDANDGIYALPAGQTTANVKFTMIDNTSIPRGVFEENSYITAMTLPDAMTYIASYSFHGVNNINTTDRNAILAINPYAFDAEPQPVVKQNIPTTAVEPIVLSSNKGGTTQNKNVLKIAEYNPSANYLDTSYWVISSSNPNFVVQGASITPSSSMEYYKVNCEFSVPQATSMSQTTDLTINFRGNDDYNPGTWTQYVTLEAETAQKQYPTANWEENGNVISNLILVEGGSSTHTLTFDATPSDSWNFMEPIMSGVSVDTTTGTVTITESSLTGGMNIAITASRMEDASYYSGYASVNIRVLPAGTDPQFYYSETSVNLDNQGMSSQTPMLNNTTGIAATPTYQSSDTSIATVDSMGTITYVAAGNTTVTATITDGVNTHTATITVYCIANKQYPTGGWYENSSQVWNLELVEGSIDAHDLTFEATPNDSWTFSYMSLPTGITLDSSTGEITVQSGALATAGEYYINANRMEDASYYSGMASLTIKVFPAGTDLNFHFDQQSVNLDNQAMTTQTPMLINSTGIDTMQHPIQYVSGDTNVATVDAYGTISFVGAGNTTVTASITNGVDTYTTSITVNCQNFA